MTWAGHVDGMLAANLKRRDHLDMGAGRHLPPPLPTLDFSEMSTFQKRDSYQILTDLSAMDVKN
jgi:hypothetical protein